MKTFICNNCKRFTYESKECEFCGCKTLTQTHPSNFKLIEKSDREKALEWWRNLGDNIGEVADKYYKGCETITGREIEQIWRKETQQVNMYNPYLDGEIIIIDKDGNKSSEFPLRPQVDFEKLKETFEALYVDMDQILMISDEYIDNFKLFFDLLSKSSTFAHKAHKILNKLNTH